MRYDPSTVAAAVPADAWQKASKSNANGGACVEFARDADGSVFVRDSKQPDDAALRFTPQEIAAFVDGARNGEFDNLI